MKIRSNVKTHVAQSYFVPTAIQRALGGVLNKKGFLTRGTIVLVVIEGLGIIETRANGYGSISDPDGRLRDWFRKLGLGATFYVGYGSESELVLSESAD
jgi:hypothetical protein